LEGAALLEKLYYIISLIKAPLPYRGWEGVALLKKLWGVLLEKLYNKISLKKEKIKFKR
jgi:hypothetical protein